MSMRRSEICSCLLLSPATRRTANATRAKGSSSLRNIAELYCKFGRRSHYLGLLRGNAIFVQPGASPFRAFCERVGDGRHPRTGRKSRQQATVESRPAKNGRVGHSGTAIILKLEDPIHAYSGGGSRRDWRLLWRQAAGDKQGR